MKYCRKSEKMEQSWNMWIEIQLFVQIGNFSHSCILLLRYLQKSNMAISLKVHEICLLRFFLLRKIYQPSNVLFRKSFFSFKSSNVILIMTPLFGVLIYVVHVIFVLLMQGFTTNNERALEELFGDEENNSKAVACLNVMATRIATVFASLRVCSPCSWTLICTN